MEMSLIQRDMWQYVDGSATLKEGASEKEKEIFRISERKALSTIALCIEPSQHPHMKEAKTPREAWLLLEQAFEPKSRVRILQLKKQAYSMRLSASESMGAYINRVRSLADKLAEVGEEVKDTELAYLMLSGLPSEYDGLMTILANLDDDRFTFAEVKKVLLTEYDRRNEKSHEKAIETGKEAYNIQAKQNGMSHRAAHSSQKRRRNRVTCFKCGKKGHYARDCDDNANSHKMASLQEKPCPNRSGNSEKNIFLLTLSDHIPDTAWLSDNGATQHVCRFREWFVNYREIPPEKVLSANEKEPENTLQAVGIGDIHMRLYVGNKTNDVVFRDVLYIPNCRRNLLSTSRVEDKGKSVFITHGVAYFRDIASGEVIGKAYRKNGLYVMCGKVIPPGQTPDSRLISNNINSLHSVELRKGDLWHQRFCHVNMKSLRELIVKNLVVGMKFSTIEGNHCEACCIGKSTKKPCKRLNTRQSSRILDLVHTDLCGPLPVNSIGGARYFITFIDDWSRKTFVYVLKSKEDVPQCVQRYIAYVERQTGKKVRRLRSDNGLEYCCGELTEFLVRLGIRHERTNVGTPQMNGVAERANRTLMDLVRSMLASAHLPQNFWGEAVVTAAYIRNKVPHLR